SQLADDRVVEDFVKSQGYKTCKRKGRIEGFIHGTGHGLGLEIHEPPWISADSKDVLKAGQVVSVEPGLYCPESGGVKLKDVVLVTSKLPCNLTEFEKVLEV
ncbi:MAG: M24 family metallopeptidase, partial [Candidatus Omnitrophica bacterium]|nr:M24 family metallopeptidase [Candidatus Omnitrophota bacterium]